MRLSTYLGFITAISLAVTTANAKYYYQPQITFIGEATFATGTQFQGTELGGLSGIDYDEANNSYIAICDDRAQNGFARFYDLTIDLSDGYLNDGDVAFTKVTEILNENGESFAAGEVDPEAIRLAPFPNTLYWTSEGDANNALSPFVRVMTRDGQPLDEFDLPEKFVPTASSGIRNNLAFESLTFSANQKQLFTATENALVQDGPIASVEEGSDVRVLRLNRVTGKANREYIYKTEAVAAESIPAGTFKTNGLVELLSVSPGKMIAVERSFSVGVGNSIKLFLTTTHGATNVRRKNSIDGLHIRRMKKKLLLDLADLGITLDNIEGITFGPRLANGDKTLIVVSDNNFNANGQFTQFLAFSVKGL